MKIPKKYGMLNRPNKSIMGWLMNEKFFDLKREKQDRIINAGLKIFAKYGYRHATTDDIVKEAGISKGLLFHYFTNKVGVYVFLMDYSVRFLLLELSRSVEERENNFFELSKQIEWGKLQVLRVYPYMEAFLERAFREECEEALKECREHKENYYTKTEAYYKLCKEEDFAGNASLEKIKTMAEYIRKQITAEHVALNTMEPERMYQQFCEYMDLLKGAFQ